MDANQPAHYGIWVYDESPRTDEGHQVTLCPGARHLARARIVQNSSLVTCRRCRELLQLLDLWPAAGGRG